MPDSLYYSAHICFLPFSKAAQASGQEPELEGHDAIKSSYELILGKILHLFHLSLLICNVGW